MPYWALLWLAWAVAAGQGALIAPLVLTASLIAQTHFTYLLQTLLLVAAGLALYVAAVCKRWGEARVSLLPPRRGSPSGSPVGPSPFGTNLSGERNIGAVLANRANE